MKKVDGIYYVISETLEGAFRVFVFSLIKVIEVKGQLVYAMTFPKGVRSYLVSLDVLEKENINRILSRSGNNKKKNYACSYNGYDLFIIPVEINSKFNSKCVNRKR